VPTISRFYGIIIAMFHREHEPAHFHVRYGGDRAVVGIDPLEVLRGTLPRRARVLVLEWAALHQAELAENWRRAQERRPLLPVEPLE
jgi:hypothetical protein